MQELLVLDNNEIVTLLDRFVAIHAPEIFFRREVATRNMPAATESSKSHTLLRIERAAMADVPKKPCEAEQLGD